VVERIVDVLYTRAPSCASIAKTWKSLPSKFQSQQIAGVDEWSNHIEAS
jgi:hypothetical protein